MHGNGQICDIVKPPYAISRDGPFEFLPLNTVPGMGPRHSMMKKEWTGRCQLLHPQDASQVVHSTLQEMSSRVADTDKDAKSAREALKQDLIDAIDAVGTRLVSEEILASLQQRVLDRVTSVIEEREARLRNEILQAVEDRLAVRE